jgi:hypothetical protein
MQNENLGGDYFLSSRPRRCGGEIYNTSLMRKTTIKDSSPRSVETRNDK